MVTATTNRAAGSATTPQPSNWDDWDYWFAGILASVVGNRRFTQDAIYDQLLEVSPESRQVLTSSFLDVFDDLLKGR